MPAVSLVSGILFLCIDRAWTQAGTTSSQSAKGPSMSPSQAASVSTPKSSDSSLIYAVAGGVGAVVLLIVIVVVVVYCVYRRRKKPKPADAEKQANRKLTSKTIAKSNGAKAAPVGDAKKMLDAGTKAILETSDLKTCETSLREAAPAKKPGSARGKAPKGSPPTDSARKKKSQAPSSAKTPAKLSLATARSKSKSSGSGESADTLRGYPESPDDKKGMLSSSRKLEPANKKVAQTPMTSSLRTAREAT